jgi:predicted HTH transcriptional regulator
VNVPVALEDWSYDTIAALARVGRCESDRHDFKFNLPDADNLTKLCCAFANSHGGFVVVGVKNRSGHFLIEGIDPDVEIAKKFSDKLNVEPSVQFSGPRHIEVPGTSKVLYVFHVPQSSLRPHIPLVPDKRVFWKRTPGGCEQMTYEEIQEQFLRYEERREKVKLLFIELLLNRENLQGMSAVQEGTYSLVTLDSGVLDRLLVDTYSVVQEEIRLIQILLTLRTNIRVMNAKTQIFFRQMAIRLIGQQEIVAAHGMFLKDKAAFLLPLIDEAIGILETKFGLTSPFPDEP